MKDKLLESFHALLFGNSSLRAQLSDQIFYARAPVTSTFPQLVFFDVADTQGYLLDYDSVTVQASIWANDEMTALSIREKVHGIFSRFTGVVSIGGGTVNINFIQLSDSGALPQDDQQLKGQFLRYQIRYRGTNIGG